MGPGLVLSRGARGFGAAVCGLLAAVVGAAVARDMAEFGVSDVLWSWTGLRGGNLFPAELVTSLVDAELLALYLVGVLVWRSAASGAYFTAVGVLTLVVRGTALWDLFDGPFPGLRWRSEPGKWAISTLAAGAVLALVLLFTVLAGRKFADQGFGPAPGEKPAPPRTGPAILAFLLLGAAAGVLAAWEVYYLTEYGWDIYKKLLIGGAAKATLSQPPSALLTWTVCLLLLAGAFAAVSRTPGSRPVGMVGGWMLLTTGIAQLAVYLDRDAFLDFGRAPTVAVLDQLTVLFELVVGVAVMLLLAPTAVRDAPWGRAAGPPLSGYGGYAPPQGGGRGW